jgi:hypothetical protein
MRDFPLLLLQQIGVVHLHDLRGAHKRERPTQAFRFSHAKKASSRRLRSSNRNTFSSKAHNGGESRQVILPIECLLDLLIQSLLQD